MNQDDFDKVLAEFWKKHPRSDGWSIETEFVLNGTTIKASIKNLGNTIVTAHAHKGVGDPQPYEKEAIAHAISYLP